jgi:hypothetical protein
MKGEILSEKMRASEGFLAKTAEYFWRKKRKNGLDFNK